MCRVGEEEGRSGTTGNPINMHLGRSHEQDSIYAGSTGCSRRGDLDARERRARGYRGIQAVEQRMVAMGPFDSCGRESAG